MPKKPRRGRTALPETERKDRLIQTRVAEDLDETLREEARKKRVTVSQLIRNVLEDTFHLVDDIVADTATLAATVTRDARRLAASAQGRSVDEQPPAPVAPAPVAPAPVAPAPVAGPVAAPAPAPAAAAAAAVTPLELIEAWQEVVLGRDAACGRCRVALRKGGKGLLGLQSDPAAPKVWLCLDCGGKL